MDEAIHQAHAEDLVMGIKEVVTICVFLVTITIQIAYTKFKQVQLQRDITGLKSDLETKDKLIHKRIDKTQQDHKDYAESVGGKMDEVKTEVGRIYTKIEAAKAETIKEVVDQVAKLIPK